MDATPTPLFSDLVLIGGGHAHVHLLKMYGMQPYRSRLKGIRLTLITRDVETPYSGMLPGYVAGHYTREDCHLDLSRLCSHSNFRMIHASAKGVTLDGAKDDRSEPSVVRTSGHVHLDDGRPPVRFDCLR